MTPPINFLAYLALLAETEQDVAPGTGAVAVALQAAGLLEKDRELPASLAVHMAACLLRQNGDIPPSQLDIELELALSDCAACEDEAWIGSYVPGSVDSGLPGDDVPSGLPAFIVPQPPARITYDAASDGMRQAIRDLDAFREGTLMPRYLASHTAAYAAGAVRAAMVALSYAIQAVAEAAQQDAAA